MVKKSNKACKCPCGLDVLTESAMAHRIRSRLYDTCKNCNGYYQEIVDGKHDGFCHKIAFKCPLAECTCGDVEIDPVQHFTEHHPACLTSGTNFNAEQRCYKFRFWLNETPAFKWAPPCGWVRIVHSLNKRMVVGVLSFIIDTMFIVRLVNYGCMFTGPASYRLTMLFGKHDDKKCYAMTIQNAFPREADMHTVVSVPVNDMKEHHKNIDKKDVTEYFKLVPGSEFLVAFDVEIFVQ